MFQILNKKKIKIKKLKKNKIYKTFLKSTRQLRLLQSRQCTYRHFFENNFHNKSSPKQVQHLHSESDSSESLSDFSPRHAINRCRPQYMLV